MGLNMLQIVLSLALISSCACLASEVHLPSWYLQPRPHSRQPCIQREQQHEAKKQAQFGEDVLLIESFFKFYKCGYYIELGGHDGMSISTTWYFHHQLSWNGLLIEANPVLFSKLKTNRPDDITVNAAICDKHQTVQFVHAEGVGGIYEFMTDYHKTTFNITTTGATPISCLPLRNLPRVFSIYSVDLLSLDVEGAELSVLRTIDFERVAIKVIIVEVKKEEERAKEIDALLRKNKYQFYKFEKLNGIYYRPDLITPLVPGHSNPFQPTT